MAAAGGSWQTIRRGSRSGTRFFRAPGESVAAARRRAIGGGSTERQARAAEIRENRTSSRQPRLKDHAATARAAKGSPLERLTNLRGRLDERIKATTEELRKVNQAKNRSSGSWEKYQKLIKRGEVAEAKADRLLARSKRLRAIEKTATPERFGLVRGSNQRKAVASEIRDLRRRIHTQESRINRAAGDSEAEAIHSAGLWGEIGQNRGRSARAKAKRMERYDRQAREVTRLAQQRAELTQQLSGARKRAKALRVR